MMAAAVAGMTAAVFAHGTRPLTGSPFPVM